MRRACVVVLGDIERSPRMRYHASSLAKEGFQVDLLGYGDTIPSNALLEDNNIHVKYLTKAPDFKYLPLICCYILKVLWQTFVLLFQMMLVKKPDFIIVQNPPAIPTLFVCWIAKSFRRSKLIIDWHNYGYTILSLKLKNTHPLVRFSRWFEIYFGRNSDHNLCVTNAMKNDLHERFMLKNVTVLYDRPADIYRPDVDVTEIHSLFKRLTEEHAAFRGCTDSDTLITKVNGNDVMLKEERCALLISSTSWTEDEDFSILVAALESYEEEIHHNKLPNLLCIITGKGPLKDFYCKMFAEKSFTHVKFCTPWLSAEDYALLLGCCDLGISLHFSSSGLDLPMKVVDMFGCCLPVCAFDFKCIDELVKHGENGLVFKDDMELAHCMKALLEDFPAKQKLNTFRNNLKSFQGVRWHQYWRTIVLPIINDIIAMAD